AGGSGFGLLSFCGASIRPGFQIVAEILKLDAAMSEADLVITGEGRLDAQTLEGKAPAGVAALAREHHKPVIAFCGAVRDEPRLAKHFDAICPIANRAMPIEKALADAAVLLEQRAAQTARSFAAGELFTAPNKAR
ncbi:MAG: glycerate kinase, partial [Verrucomicrobiota bacterium]|nr:glycerate kinase [Verrucomicrobiota bacterium]